MNRKMIAGSILSLGMVTGLAGFGVMPVQAKEKSTESDTAEYTFIEIIEKATEILNSGFGQRSKSGKSAGSSSGDSADGSTGKSADSSTGKSADSSKKSSGSVTAEKVSMSEEELFSDRDLDASYDASTAETITLSGTTASVSGSGAEVGQASDGSPVITVKKEGTYVVSGSLTDGQILVDVGDEDKVQLVLSGVTMSNDDSACIFVKNADKVFITLAEGTTNTLSDAGKEYTETDNDSTVDGVIYAKDDVTFNGTGTLKITAGYKHGIVGKDDLKFIEGTYEVTAVKKGITANDSIRVKDGSFTIDAGDDGLHTSNGDEDGKGYIYIGSGTYQIKSGDDGIHAETDLLIKDGTINITESEEGLEGYTVTIDNGDITIVASDDGINAAGGSTNTNDRTEGNAAGKSKDNVTGKSADNAIGKSAGDAAGKSADKDKASDSQEQDSTKTTGDTAEGDLDPSETIGQNGQMPNFQDGERPEFPGGQDGQMPNFQDGQMPNSQDGQMPNFQDGQMPGNFGGRMGGFGGFESDENAVITINDGKIYVNAGGDGLDSNGGVTINGDVIYVDGPTNAGNAALDMGTEMLVNGGTVVAAGSTGMDETFSTGSKQYSIKYNFSSTQSAGTEVQLLDSTGVAIMKYTPSKEYSSVILSSKDITDGTYTIKAGSTEESVTVSSTVTTAGTASGGMGGRGGKGPGGQRPNGQKGQKGQKPGGQQGQQQDQQPDGQQDQQQDQQPDKTTESTEE